MLSLQLSMWLNISLQSEAPEAHQGISSMDDIRWQYATLSACCHRHTVGLPHTCREAAEIPWPVRYRLSIVQSLRMRSNSGWQEVGSVIKNWLGISCSALSSFQASCADQTELGMEDHIGHLDDNRSSGWPKISSNTGRLGRSKIF